MKDMIHVIIDGRMIDEHLHGIARYTYELIKNSSESDEVFYSILVNDIALGKKIFKDIKNIEFILMKSKFLSLGEQLELPKIVNKFKGKAIFHSPSFVGSPFIKTDMVMTIHDLNHIRFPQFYTPFHKYYYKFIVKSSANLSKKLLTVSEFSKLELVDWLECKKDKVVVTYNGIDKNFNVIKEQLQLEAIRNKYKLHDKFILYVGNLKPHKNVETLVEAMKYLQDEKIKLVINGRVNESLKQIVDKHGLQDKIQFIGFVDDDDLSGLYNLAEVFIFPSLYEGFGLPPLEAMACGCPTIVSNTSSLPEVVGDNAIKIEPKDHKALADGIKMLLRDELKRELIIEGGIRRAKEFSWTKTANETIKIYKEILNLS
ncbi:glycosyltransferase family 4 protein [Clostridium folliculivorans]|uniref:glycosyltransferase family 4 protein n=1 Tax=Clostridium folliculivorans TaxID=2886038 RepID=UPI0021C46965|nr:glycosyltransferase family 1 protein [Clostridium folliculivorans]GKU31661.1 glycosyl transferase [Clostridium folliculivorans]